MDARTETLPAGGGIPSRLARLGPYAPIAAFLLICSVGWALSRAALIAWKWDRVEPLGAAGHILLQGLRSDLITLGWTLAPVLLALLPCALMRRLGGWLRWTCAWLAACCVFFAFMELATPQFIMEYDVRPNRTFAEYLMWPKEVLAMIWGGYRAMFLGALGVLAVIGWAARRHFRRYPADARLAAMPARRILAVWPLAVLAVFMMIRSNFHGRPVHLGNFAFSDDPMVNSLVVNSAYTMLFSVYEMKHETGLTVQYGKMPPADMIRQVRADMGVPAADFLSDELPTLHRQTATVRRDKPLNIVIVLSESMGARWTKTFGGWGVTPNIDSLVDKGIWFDRLYATGTRTSRGIEGAIAAFPPTPAKAVVRLSKAQKDFFTIATALRGAGFYNEFIYGGDSNFDNRGRFLLSNGFHSVIDQADYENPVFDGYLGVSDEDMLAKAHERLLALHGKGQPFFVLALTITNHPPYDFPDGRIELAAPEKKQQQRNAAKYADYAIGQFLQRARAAPYWNDTLFLVMADHEADQHLDVLVPPQGFHIPGAILGPGIEPRRVASIVSQIDIAPTLLSLAGVDADVPFIGRDLTRSLPEFGNRKGPTPRAMMQHNQNFGWLEGDVLTVLSPDGSDVDADPDVRAFSFDVPSKVLTPLPAPDPETARRALANALMPAWLYEKKKYRADPAVSATRP